MGIHDLCSWGLQRAPTKWTPCGWAAGQVGKWTEGWDETETPSLFAKPSTCFNKRAISISKLSGPSYSQLPFIQAHTSAKHWEITSRVQHEGSRPAYHQHQWYQHQWMASCILLHHLCLYINHTRPGKGTYLPEPLTAKPEGKLSPTGIYLKELGSRKK